MRRALLLSSKAKPRPLSKESTLRDFIAAASDGDAPSAEEMLPNSVPYLPESGAMGQGRSFHITTYGCQMNVSDSEIVHSVLETSGYTRAESSETADIVLLNTCAIRDKAEERVWNKLKYLKSERRRDRLVGVLGCMAERLKENLLESGLSDVVVGPDAYRSLPHLLYSVQSGAEETAINVMLSQDETYQEIAPVRAAGVSAFISIMRGCDEHCAYCVVPQTRGRERSRPIKSILAEVKQLSEDGFKEITLLGQNVNSYRDRSEDGGADVTYSEGFRANVKVKSGGVAFAELLEQVAAVDPEMRIRFTSPHPKDFPDRVLGVIAKHPNICKNIHIPAQSGSNTVLERMRRNYTRESYLALIKKMREKLPGVSLSTDMISGFCGETEEEHQDTLSLMAEVNYDHAFMFAYSMREKTKAHRRYKDDVDEEVKGRRLKEVIEVFHEGLKARAPKDIDTEQLVLIEGRSKRNEAQWTGRIDENRRVVFEDHPTDKLSIGDYAVVRIDSSTNLTLKGTALKRSSISEFYT